MKNSTLDMQMSRVRRLITALVVALLGVALGGCERGFQWDEAQQAALEERVRERWQKMSDHDFAGAYEFMSPNYRKNFAKQLYVSKFSYATAWELTEVKALNYDSEAAVASVVVRVMSKPTKQTSSASVAIGAIPKNLRERWIFAEGDWWFSANY